MPRWIVPVSLGCAALFCIGLGLLVNWLARRFDDDEPEPIRRRKRP